MGVLHWLGEAPAELGHVWGKGSFQRYNGHDGNLAILISSPYDTTPDRRMRSTSFLSFFFLFFFSEKKLAPFIKLRSPEGQMRAQPFHVHVSQRSEPTQNPPITAASQIWVPKQLHPRP